MTQVQETKVLDVLVDYAYGDRLDASYRSAEYTLRLVLEIDPSHRRAKQELTELLESVARNARKA